MTHVLNGVAGWSIGSGVKKIDASKVKNMTYRKRLFRVFNRDKPFSLEIEYYFGNKLMPFNYYTITKRYSSEMEVQREIRTIAYKKYKYHQHLLAPMKK